MGKVLWCAFLALLLFNTSFSFSEAKVLAPSQSEIKARAADEGPSITVYNQNRALIKEKRLFDLEQGVNRLEWDNLAATIDIRSVNLSSVNAAKPIEVKEQSYQSDLISSSAILSRSIGKSIVLRHFFSDGKTEEQAGVLLASPSQYERVVKIGDRYVLNPEGQIELIEMPSDLVAQPKLSFVVKASESGSKNLLLAYEANSINWQCDYNLLLNGEQNKFDLTGWVTLTNQCGMAFKNVNLKLIAGSMHTNRNDMEFAAVKNYYALPRETGSAPQEQAFADYHLYTFPEPVDINNNETKRLTLVERKAIPVVKKYIFDQQYYTRTLPKPKAPVEIKLEFQNDEKNKRPLPAGQVRVYQADADNDMQLIGEDRIMHTAVGEKITIKLGEAFDIVGERTRVNSEQTSNHHRKDTFKVTFNNHLDKDIVVTDIEHVPELAVFSSDSPFSKIDSNALQSDVKVPANGTSDVSYVLESKF